MTVYNFLNNLGINNKTKIAIFSIMCDLPRNMTNQTYTKYAKMYNLEKDYAIPENVVELMIKVNRMVKDKSCPNNFKNRFYYYKHKLIKKFISEGRVSEIYGEGDCYSMVIDGRYCVHQLRSNFPVSLTVNGEREYSRSETYEIFDKKTFDDFQIAAIYYLAK